MITTTDDIDQAKQELRNAVTQLYAAGQSIYRAYVAIEGEAPPELQAFAPVPTYLKG